MNAVAFLLFCERGSSLSKDRVLGSLLIRPPQLSGSGRKHRLAALDHKRHEPLEIVNDNLEADLIEPLDGTF